MADLRITDLVEKGDIIEDDWIEIVDTEDTTDGPEGTSKKVKLSCLITHQPLIKTIRIHAETFIWMPLSANTSGVPEYGDYAFGRILNYKYELKYNAGDPTLFESWHKISKQKLYQLLN